MTDEEKLKQQLTFFDYIYPSMSRQFDSLNQKVESLNCRMLSLEEKRKYHELMIEQYKGKIQRIEQFLIENGLIRLLGKQND